MTVAKEPAAEARRRTEQVALVAFVSYSLLAGGNAVCIRFSNRELAPLWGAGLRFALAAALLLLVMAVLRLPIPRGRALAGAVLYGALTFGGAFALAYYALVRMHAGFGQIVLALVPLATLILAVLWRQERFRTAALAGCLLSLAGIAVMSQAPLRESVPPTSLLAAVGSVLCFAQGALLVRRFPASAPGGDQRPRHDGGSGAAAGRVRRRRRAMGAAETGRDMVGSRLPRGDRVRRGLRVVCRRASVLGRVPCGVRIRDHPVRHRHAFGMAR